MSSNYRSIAVIPIVGKILEIIIKDNLVQYLESKHLISDSQCGFRKERVKERKKKSILSLIDYVVQGLDEGKNISVLIYDLTKAFDCVNINILLDKLEFYNIRALQLDFFKSFLCNRKQFVQIKTDQSELLPVLHGVSQGSILGPILFLVYINDLPKIVNQGSCFLYADDTIICSGTISDDTCWLKLQNGLQPRN